MHSRQPVEEHQIEVLFGCASVFSFLQVHWELIFDMTRPQIKKS